MRTMASQITSLTIVYSTVYSRRRSKKTSKLHITGLCVRGIHRSPGNSPHKWPATRKMLPLDDVTMETKHLRGIRQRADNARKLPCSHISPLKLQFVSLCLNPCNLFDVQLLLDTNLMPAIFFWSTVTRDRQMTAHTSHSKLPTYTTATRSFWLRERPKSLVHKSNHQVEKLVL